MQTVLVVDDWAPVVHAIRRELKRDFAVVEATSAEEAQQVQLGQLSAAVIDILMPLNGLELAASMRERGFTGPFLFITTSPDPQLSSRVAELSPARLVRKPWNHFELRTTLHELLGS